jgi:pSer/pThr/pTyr-binding forkhead associated (FHA) protein
VQLIVANGDDTLVFPLPDQGSFVIGRERTCQLRPRSAFVSRRHAEISREGSDLILRDLDSTNGTSLNGARILVPTPLEDGDKVQIGPIELTVAIGLETSPSNARQTAEDVVSAWLMPDEDSADESRRPGRSPVKMVRKEEAKFAAVGSRNLTPRH